MVNNNPAAAAAAAAAAATAAATATIASNEYSNVMEVDWDASAIDIDSALAQADSSSNRNKIEELHEEVVSSMATDASSNSTARQSCCGHSDSEASINNTIVGAAREVPETEVPPVVATPQPLSSDEEGFISGSSTLIDSNSPESVSQKKEQQVPVKEQGSEYEYKQQQEEQDETISVLSHHTDTIYGLPDYAFAEDTCNVKEDELAAPMQNLSSSLEDNYMVVPSDDSHESKELGFDFLLVPSLKICQLLLLLLVLLLVLLLHPSL